MFPVYDPKTGLTIHSNYKQKSYYGYCKYHQKQLYLAGYMHQIEAALEFDSSRLPYGKNSNNSTSCIKFRDSEHEGSGVFSPAGAGLCKYCLSASVPLKKHLSF